MNLEPKVKSDKLTFGTAWHSAMEAFYNNLEASRDEQRTLMHDALSTSLTENLASKEAELLHLIIPEVYEERHMEIQKDFKESLDLGYGMIEAFLDWNTETNHSKGMVLVSTEQRLVIPLGNSDRFLTTRLDGVVKFGSGYKAGSHWVLEHKSVSKSTNIFNPMFLPLDLQLGTELLVYNTLAEQEKFEPAIGAVYTMARKQLPSARVRNPIIASHDVYKSKAELDNLYWQLHELTAEMARAIYNPDLCYHNPQIWGGYCTWGCPFVEACEMMNRDFYYEDYLEENFKSKEGDSELMSNTSEEGDD